MHKSKEAVAQCSGVTGGGITMPIHSRLHGTMNWRGFLFLIATTTEVRLRWHGSTVEKKEQSSGIRDITLCKYLSLGRDFLPKLFRSPCLALIWTRQIYPCMGCQCRSLWSIWQHLRKRKEMDNKWRKQIQPNKKHAFETLATRLDDTTKQPPIHNSRVPITFIIVR